MESTGGADAPESMDEEKSEYSPYELKDMAETLQKAAEIQSDPDLMKLLTPMLDKKVKSIKTLQDLRDLANKPMDMTADDSNESADDSEPSA